MSTRIFKLWLVKPYFEAMELSQERVDGYFSKNVQVKKDLGVRDLLFGRVWSDENLTHWGVELYPDWKAVREHNRCMEEIHFYQAMRSEVFLGVDPEDSPNALEPLEASVYNEGITQIWLANLLPAFYEADQSVEAEAGKVFELQKSLGTRNLVNAKSRPIDERWDGWGIELYPSMEALLEKFNAQEKMKWWKYLKARTFLGTAESGEMVRQRQ